VSSSRIEDHGLGAPWQGFELTKTYEDGGIWKVDVFADLEPSDALPEIYSGFEVSGFADSGHEVLLHDARLPDITGGMDAIYVVLPPDGLQGSLDGVAGTFACPAGHCSLLNTGEVSTFAPWVDSQAIRFTPADSSQPEVMLDVPQLVSPSAEVPRVNYLAFGSWLYTPGDPADVEAFEFGVYAGGDDPFAQSSLEALSGTARYAGSAAGTYAETLLPHTEAFTAEVALTANFDFRAEGELGRVTGQVSNFSLASGKPAPVSALRLQSSYWVNDVPGGSFDGHTSGGGGDWRGEWGGRLFGNDPADAAAHPTSIAGTFGATDGTHIFAGSFGAHRQ